MTDEELGRELHSALLSPPEGTLRSDCWTHVAARARELLAKPVATREGVYREVVRFCQMWSRDDSHSDEMKTNLALHILSHFAPPRQRMMIEGMGFDELNKEMHQAYKVAVMGDGAQLANALSICAATAHRLATTPAPEVDAVEEKAKALHALAKNAAVKAGWPGEVNRWEDLHEGARAGWRAVAAMEKGNG